MPDKRTLNRMKREVAASGFSAAPWEQVSEPRPWVYWRNRDGVLLPNRLPADEYSYKVYRGKGFTPVPDEIAEPELEQMIEAKIRAREMRETVPHAHKFNQKLGSPCKVPGCPETRTTPYKKRGTT